MKSLFYCVSCYLLVSFLVAEENPWSVGIFKRIINRKHVSHLVIETRENHYRLTLIVSDRFPYNYKSAQYPFFFRFKTIEEANQMLKKIDIHLDSGEELKIYLEGSQIIEIEFLNGK